MVVVLQVETLIMPEALLVEAPIMAAALQAEMPQGEWIAH